MADARKPALGRGLSALLGDPAEDYASLDKLRSPRTLPIEHLKPNPAQPRRSINDADLQELAASIAANGVLQPILARPINQDQTHYEIVAGERRWRAAQLAQLHEVPVVIRDMDDRETLQVALVENLQRADLTPLEEAQAYQRLLEDFGHTQEDVAKAVGKSRSHIANTVRLLGLPESVKSMVGDGRLSAGHARAILSAESPEATAQEVVSRALNVRQTEDLVARTPKPRLARPVKAPDADTARLERDLSSLLGLRVEIRFRGTGGEIVLHYASLDQLDDILHRLGKEPGTPGVSLANSWQQAEPGAHSRTDDLTDE